MLLWWFDVLLIIFMCRFDLLHLRLVYIFLVSYMFVNHSKFGEPIVFFPAIYSCLFSSKCAESTHSQFDGLEMVHISLMSNILKLTRIHSLTFFCCNAWWNSLFCIPIYIKLKPWLSCELIRVFRSRKSDSLFSDAKIGIWQEARFSKQSNTMSLFQIYL